MVEHTDGQHFGPDRYWEDIEAAACLTEMSRVREHRAESVAYSVEPVQTESLPTEAGGALHPTASMAISKAISGATTASGNFAGGCEPRSVTPCEPQAMIDSPISERTSNDPDSQDRGMQSHSGLPSESGQYISTPLPTTSNFRDSGYGSAGRLQNATKETALAGNGLTSDMVLPPQSPTRSPRNSQTPCDGLSREAIDVSWTGSQYRGGSLIADASPDGPAVAAEELSHGTVMMPDSSAVRAENSTAGAHSHVSSKTVSPAHTPRSHAATPTPQAANALPSPSQGDQGPPLLDGSDVSNSRTDIQDLTITELQVELAVAWRDEDTARVAADRLTSQVDRLHHNLAALFTRNNDTHRLIDRQSEEIRRLTDKWNQLQEECTHFFNERDELLDEVDQSETKAEKLNEENTRLQDECNQFQDEAEELRTENSRLDEQLKNESLTLKNQILRLYGQLSGKETELIEAWNENKEIRAEKEAKRKGVLRMMEEYEKAKRTGENLLERWEQEDVARSPTGPETRSPDGPGTSS